LSKAPLAIAAALFLAGCGSTPTPTPTRAPSPFTQPTPRLGPTPSPISATLVDFTAPPQPALASAPPSEAPTTTASPTPPPGLLFTDPTLDESSGWNELSASNAAFSFVDGALASTLEKKGSWAFAVHELPSAETVVRVSGSFISSGAGYFGWLCGDSATGRYYGAVPQTDGSLVFIAGGNDGVAPLERYDSLNVAMTDGQTTQLGLECVIDHGRVWLQAFLGTDEPIAVHEEDVTDVTHFDVVGMYGESLQPPFSMSVRDVTAYGMGGSTGATSLPAAALIGGVADTTSADCVETLPAADALVGVDCYVQDEGAGPEFLELDQYRDPGAMQAAFDLESSAQQCGGAPARAAWANGAVRCVGQTVGLRVEWTDGRSDVIGRLVDLDGDYALTDAAWRTIAGID